MKEINGFPGYFITQKGEVFSIKTGKYVLMKPFRGNSKGKKTYYMIGLIDNKGKRHKKIVHRLVAEAYIPNPDNLPEVNHKDKNMLNNTVENLEWVTRKENLRQSYETMSPTRNFRWCFLYKDGELVGGFQSVMQAARFAHAVYGVSKTSMTKYLKCNNVEIRKINNN